MAIKTKGYLSVGSMRIKKPVTTRRESLNKLKVLLRNPGALKIEKQEGRVWW